MNRSPLKKTKVKQSNVESNEWNFSRPENGYKAIKKTQMKGILELKNLDT